MRPTVGFKTNRDSGCEVKCWHTPVKVVSISHARESKHGHLSLRKLPHLASLRELPHLASLRKLPHLASVLLLLFTAIHGANTEAAAKRPAAVDVHFARQR
jgi:hypothetical protein